MVIAFEKEHFPNIKCYSSSTGETLWSYSHTMEVYSLEFDRIETQVQPYDLELLGDLDSDGVRDTAVSVGHSVVALSGKDGKQIWEVSHEINFWELKRLGNTLFAGTQDGYIYAIDPSTGEVKYRKRLAEPFSHRDIGEVARSVWSIKAAEISGTTMLAVSTEDGKVQVVNPEDGSVKWEKKVLDYNETLLREYYQGWSWRGGRGTPPTLPIDSNFFNLKLTVVDDTDGDGSDDIVASVNPNLNSTGRGYQGAEYALYMLSGSDGTIRWQNKAISMVQVGNICFSSDQGGGSLLVPSGRNANQEVIGVLSLEDGRAENSIDVKVVPRGESFNEQERFYLYASGERLVMVSDYGDLSVCDFEGELIWEFPRMANLEIIEGNFTDGGMSELLVYSKNSGRGRMVQSRSLMLRGGGDGSILWSNIIPRRDFLENGGYSHISKVKNVLGNGELGHN